LGCECSEWNIRSEEKCEFEIGCIFPFLIIWSIIIINTTIYITYSALIRAVLNRVNTFS
jgi:hypothetical protein